VNKWVAGFTRRAVRRSTILLLTLALFPVFNLPTSARAQLSVTAFTIDSEFGDYIGAGQTIVFVPPDSVMAAGTADTVNMAASSTAPAHDFSATLAAPTGQTLEAGTTYSARRFRSDTMAGLDVTGEGRGCNETVGAFTVHEISVDDVGVLTQFAATYEQHCEGGPYALFGELRYNSSLGFRAAVATPNRLTFPDTEVGSTSAPQDVMITNEGTEGLTMGAAAVGGDYPADFSIVADGCSNTSVVPGDGCSMSIAFEPSGGSGDRSALVHIPDDTARGRRDISVYGRALAPVPIVSSVIPVKTSSRDEFLPTAGEDFLAWTQNRAGGRFAFKAFAQPDGGSSFGVSSGGVGFTGGIDGTRIVYQQLNKRRTQSNLKIFDLQTRVRSDPPPGVNTARWEWQPTMSGDWLLFGRNNFATDVWQVVLFNVVTGEQRLLDSIRKTRRTYIQPGQVSGNYAVWYKVGGGDGDVFIYDIAAGSTTRIDDLDWEYGPSITSDGTMYFSRTNVYCGPRDRLVARTVGGEEFGLRRLPQGRDISSLFAFSDSAGVTHVYFDLWRCTREIGQNAADIMKVTVD
jgi:hypothetical protein